MATLVLTVVGGAIGGPIGAAIGGAIGSAIDSEVLLKPKGRQGPRLSELAVQTSSYGTPIPRLYGTMRVAGSVVWATDLKETRNKSGGGKGKPSATTYSYSASLAVLLSARAIEGVGRIWADGKLLRGAAGDLKAQTGFRLHPGDEEQAADPLIAAAEGAAQTPALRGQAYAVFEDLQLADYGNRIPSLTFEVIADSTPPTVGSVAADFGVAAETPGRVLGGFSAYGDSARGVLETLAGIDGGWFAAGPDGIMMRTGPGTATTVADPGYAADGKSRRQSRSLASAMATPRVLAVAHYDPARDYQTGLQRVGRPGAATREDRVELPASLDAPAAKAVAEGMLARAGARRETRTVMLAAGVAGDEAAGGLAVAPGDRVAIAGEGGQWRVGRWALERMVVRLELERIARAPVAVPATPGRVVGAPDLIHGPTVVHAFELPALGDTPLDAPRLTIAAAGGPGWRQAVLLVSTDDGGHWGDAGAAMTPATIGTVTAPPASTSALLIDLAASIEVELLHAGMMLADADAAGLDAGANLAMVGDELVQFGRAEMVGPRHWRLSRLLRGRRGTEAAMAEHVAGERFVLMEPDVLAGVTLPLAALGGTVRVLASGVGDVDGPAEAATLLTGASVRPPPPVQLSWTPSADGGAEVRWVRRSRAGWRWADGGDVPLGEDTEVYRVAIGERLVIADHASATVTTDERAGGATVVAIRQLGTLAASDAAAIVVPAS